jgi:hypothetical protein
VALTEVQDKRATGTSASASATLSPAATAGNLIVIRTGGDFTASTPAGFTLTGSGVSSAAHYQFYKIAAGGETAITVTYGGSTNWSIQVQEFSGNPPTSPLDASGQTNGGQNVNTVAVTTSGSVANAGGTALAGVTVFDEVVAASWTNSFVADYESNQNHDTMTAGRDDPPSGSTLTTTNNFGGGSNNTGPGAVLGVYKGAVTPTLYPVFLAAGTIAEGTTAALTPGLPAGMAVGGLMLLCSVAKQSTVTIPVPSGWTLVGSATGGTGTAGIDLGTLICQIAYRIYQAGDTAPSLTIASASPAHHVIIGYAPGTTGDTMDVPTGNGGGDTTAGTGYSATGSANLSVTTNDLLVAVTGNVTDTPTPGTVTLTATSATLAASSSRVDDANTQGNDSRITIVDSTVTAGTSTAAPAWSNTWGGTNAAASMGATMFVRVRQLAAAAASPFFPRRWQPNYRR